jgi:hypothetical protein
MKIDRSPHVSAMAPPHPANEVCCHLSGCNALSARLEPRRASTALKTIRSPLRRQRVPKSDSMRATNRGRIGSGCGVETVVPAAPVRPHAASKVHQTVEKLPDVAANLAASCPCGGGADLCPSAHVVWESIFDYAPDSSEGGLPMFAITFRGDPNDQDDGEFDLHVLHLLAQISRSGIVVAGDDGFQCAAVLPPTKRGH